MSCDPQVLLTLLRQCGLQLGREGPEMVVVSAGGLTPEMRDALRRHKPDLWPLLPERRR